MKYEIIEEAVFLQRPNRFIAKVLLNGCEQTVHVKNTGRCRELLVPGATVYLSESDNVNRKTKYDLVAVVKQRKNDSLLINMDSQIPNDVAAEWLPESGLFEKGAVFKREVTQGDSRFDFCITEKNRTSFLEVKGVTLEKDGHSLFPDAPTQRGVKHINELCRCAQNGYGAYILFIIQMKGVKDFLPNSVTDPDFAAALKTANDSGVKILAVDCITTKNDLSVDLPVSVVL